MGYKWNRIDSKKSILPEKSILNFMSQLAEDRVNLHGFALLHKYDLLANIYYKPFKAESLHRMYSVGKSFVSLAIGILLSEGKIALEDPICNYFQDKLPKEGVHPYIAEIRIKDMLSMRTAHGTTTYKRYAGDWVESFFNIEPSHRPGTVFSYDTSSTHVLSALVERLSGLELLEFLRIKCLNEIGFSKEAYMIKDPYGVSQGGSGLVCRLDDILRVARLFLDKGIYKGKQLVSSDYLKEATGNQVDTILQSCLDEQLGYGYQTWRVRNKGFSFYGIGGQLAVCFPEEDFILATTADTLNNPNGIKDIYDAFFQHIYPYISSNKCNESKNKLTGSLHEIEESLSAVSVKDLSNFKFETYLDAHTLGKQINNLQYTFDENKLGIESLQLNLEKEKGILKFILNGYGHEILFGIENISAKFKDKRYDGYTSGTWLRKNVFYIKTYLMGEYLASVSALLVFRENSVTVSFKHTEKEIFEEYKGTATGFCDFRIHG